jgi:hypothetical protein
MIDGKSFPLKISGNFYFELSVVAPEVSAKVIRVEPPDGAKFDTGEGNLPPPPAFIELFFDKSLQEPTLNANTVRVVRSESGGPTQPWPGAVTYNDATRSARFTPDQRFDGSPLPGGFLYTLTIFGDGPGITDVDGLALDGNSDGLPGGNFTSTFSVTQRIG